MKKKENNIVNRNEFGVTTATSTRIGRSSPISKKSRALDLRSMKVTVIHKPSGISISKTIPEGNYRKKELIKNKQLIVNELIEKLSQDYLK